MASIKMLSIWHLLHIRFRFWKMFQFKVNLWFLGLLPSFVYHYIFYLHQHLQSIDLTCMPFNCVENEIDGRFYQFLKSVYSYRKSIISFLLVINGSILEIWKLLYITKSWFITKNRKGFIENSFFNPLNINNLTKRWE